MSLAERSRRLLPGVWLGVLVCIALLATPAPFAVLAPVDAGRVAGRMLAHEAYTSLAFGLGLLILERLAARRQAASGRSTQFSGGMMLALGAVFCTIAGYFVVQPMMIAARAGQGALSFGQLHAVSAAFYAIKTGIVAVLAWRALRALSPGTSS
jgi:hypothetical protein